MWGGEPGNGRQAAKVVTVKWGHGAGLRAQRGHTSHFSIVPCQEEVVEVLGPTLALTDGAAPRRSPPRPYEPAQQLASRGPRQSQRTSQRQRMQETDSSKKKRPGRLGGHGQIVALCPLPFLGLGAPGLYKDLGIMEASSPVNICCDAQPFSRKYRPQLPWTVWPP